MAFLSSACPASPLPPNWTVFRVIRVLAVWVLLFFNRRYIFPLRSSMCHILTRFIGLYTPWGSRGDTPLPAVDGGSRSTVLSLHVIMYGVQPMNCHLYFGCFLLSLGVIISAFFVNVHTHIFHVLLCAIDGSTRSTDAVASIWPAGGSSDQLFLTAAASCIGWIMAV